MLVSNPEDMGMSDFCPSLFDIAGSQSPEAFDAIVREWVTEDNVNLFHHPPLAVAITKSWTSSPDQSVGWKGIACRLIAMGASYHDELKNVPRSIAIRGWHHYISSYKRTTSFLDYIMEQALDPFDSEIVGAHMIDILSVSNVDIPAFLQTERQNHLKDSHVPYLPFMSHLDRKPRILRVVDQAPFSISWDWWLDPNDAAFEVLHEFRHLGSPRHSRYGYYFSSDELRDWPYIYPRSAYCLAASELGWPFKRDEALAKLFRARFERRCQKKEEKFAKIQGTRSKSGPPKSLNLVEWGFVVLYQPLQSKITIAYEAFYEWWKEIDEKIMKWRYNSGWKGYCFEDALLFAFSYLVCGYVFHFMIDRGGVWGYRAVLTMACWGGWYTMLDLRNLLRAVGGECWQLMWLFWDIWIGGKLNDHR